MSVHEDRERTNKKRIILALRIVMPIVAIICVVAFPPWRGILAWLEPLPDTVEQQVDRAVEHGLDGIIVHVDRAGAAPVQYGAGWKDREGRIPADPGCLFKIASISKLYVAAAAARLIAADRLSLDDTLADRLPEFVGRIEHADRITVRTLLQHRSGIANFTDQDGYDWAQPPPTNQACLDLVVDRPADFEPDTDRRYSNTNFLLIGRILDDVLGYPHQRFIREEFLVSRGLRHTHGLLREVDLDDVASGYHCPYEVDFKDIEFVSPGGCMVAAAQDVAVFVRALNDGTLLSSAEQAVYDSVSERGHKGWVLGYQSIARYHEDLDAVVVQFVNTTGGDSELVALVVYDRIVKILREQ